MLGAQARAAELQAAKSAAMRQKAHKDAQDLAKIPVSTPVSLTDFARNPLMSKNKGVKAFRPLNDSDFEASMTNSTDLQQSDSTPATTEEIGLSLLDSVPTAPRAMIARSESLPLPHSSKMTPSRATAPAFTPQSLRQDILQRSSDIHDGVSSALPHLDTTTNAIGYVFGPDDLSPNKQEIKYSERDQYDNSRGNHFDPYNFSPPYMPSVRIFPQQESFHYEQTCHPQCSYTQFPSEMYMNHPDQPIHLAMNQYYSDGRAIARDYGIEYDQNERSQSFANDLLDHQNRIQAGIQHRELQKAVRYIPAHEQPYDRTSKMQSFVAAQQAMARTGKTVLHNPNLHKSPPSAEKSSPTPQEISIKTVLPSVSPLSFHSAMSRRSPSNEVVRPIPRQAMKLEDKRAILRAILKRDSTQPETLPESNSNEENGTDIVDMAETLIDGQDDKPHFAEFGTDDWCTLRPISMKEREAMLRKVRRLAAEEFDDLTKNSMAHSVNIVGKDAQEWLLNASTHASDRREAVNRIVDDHEDRKDCPKNYGVIGKPVFKEMSDLSSRGGLRAVANIMATIYTDGSENDLKDNRYTSAPRYAIDDNTISKSIGSSLFDDLGFKVPRTAIGVNFGGKNLSIVRL